MTNVERSTALEGLRAELPEAVRESMTVGHLLWVWVSFDCRPPRGVLARLSALGYRWNPVRQVWEHSEVAVVGRGGNRT